MPRYSIYVDESGNSGANSDDEQEPVFVLGALIVPDDKLHALESDLDSAVVTYFPHMAANTEIHGVDLRSGHGLFKGVNLGLRSALRDDWLRIAAKHDLKFVSRDIEKKRFAAWISEHIGTKQFNPHVAAFALVAQRVNYFLSKQSVSSVGEFICHRTIENEAALRRALMSLRADDGQLRLSNIAERVTFIGANESRSLQLCDVCALSARKTADHGVQIQRFLKERNHLDDSHVELSDTDKAKVRAKYSDAGGIELLGDLTYEGDERFEEVMRWLQGQLTAGSTI